MTDLKWKDVTRTPESKSLIDRFHLQPHPEGGHFKEVFRSKQVVTRESSRLHIQDNESQQPVQVTRRSALTEIYFLLEKGDFSRFHKVVSDEAWHHLSGGPLQLILLSPNLEERINLLLEPADVGEAIQVVPSSWWQAAIPLQTHTLCSCSVGPGFDFADFEMAKDGPAAKQISRRFPDLAHLV